MAYQLSWLQNSPNVLAGRVELIGNDKSEAAFASHFLSILSMQSGEPKALVHLEGVTTTDQLDWLHEMLHAAQAERIALVIEETTDKTALRKLIARNDGKVQHFDSRDDAMLWLHSETVML